ncbi:MAG: hypothetical protein ACK4OM_03090 [Alphaproteobacteria bacterium]
MKSSYPEEKLTIIGGGIIGFFQASYAYQAFEKQGKRVRITIYEKNKSLLETTAAGVAPSLTDLEMSAVLPSGDEFEAALRMPFHEAKGIKIEDVPGINDSFAGKIFKEAVSKSSTDYKAYEESAKFVLSLGKKSMKLWQKLYDEGDDELKAIMRQSNYNPCRETEESSLHQGYRIDVIYNMKKAEDKANSIIQACTELGYKHCRIISPKEAIKIDPYLQDFCNKNSKDGKWNDDSIALWRPGGCIDASVFLPKFEEYLSRKLGNYVNNKGYTKNCFGIKFDREVTGFELKDNEIINVKFTEKLKRINHIYKKSNYAISVGEAVGSLDKFGFASPADAGFAGSSLRLNIELPADKIIEYSNLNHCMEVYQEGIILAWQAKFIDGKISIKVAGTKAFYGHYTPHKNHEFCKNRNLVQLNMINDMLPDLISIALGKETRGIKLTAEDLNFLEDQSIAQRWVGRRSVAYDNSPTLGQIYLKNGTPVKNGTVITHAGSGGASFGPALAKFNQDIISSKESSFIEQIKKFCSSYRGR